MKKLLLAITIICLSLQSHAQEVRQCKAITKAGRQCSRKATKDGYCTQHYKMFQQGKLNKDKRV